MGRRRSMRELWRGQLSPYEKDIHEDSDFKSYLMVCVMVSVVTVIVACRELKPQTICFRATTPSVKYATRAMLLSAQQDNNQAGWRCVAMSSHDVQFEDGAPDVHVNLPNTLMESSLLGQIKLQGGWPHMNTLLHVLACSASITTVVFLKNRVGFVPALVWSCNVLLFLMTLATDASTVLAWRDNCSMMGLVLAQEFTNSVPKDVETECFVEPRLTSVLLFAVAGCLCAGNALIALFHRPKLSTASSIPSVCDPNFV
ncbi:hypothetical protein Ae201684P_009381 [Aphanomyces euteiches]|nr:hypothetical protein Ae201684P_009381 [Aphanomyces euteiches]KAH9133691.1 hypothetical protein AeRB84_020284 [Aphanomyces euteiches]